MKYLDPQFTDHITVPDAMKLEFILAGNILGQINQMKDNFFVYLLYMALNWSISNVLCCSCKA